MATTNYTFQELITKYKINIPIIQRDYAQGREEEKLKRDSFLDSIFKHLTCDDQMDLDFIYGRIKGKTFFPIDGQQRLTTLFLLHWYISLKEEIEIKEKNKLIKFAYDTRISSREFCERLVKEEIRIPSVANENNFSEMITNYYWFRDSWTKDPTIKAMLIMIQAIHEKFLEVQPNHNLWEKLTNQRIISFETLDLGAKGFELTDELYIKMNSRGKQLTPFENFKANFIQFIDGKYEDQKLKHPVKGQISYSGYFSYKIEKEWMDLFWAFRGKAHNVDNLFMNWFAYVAELCFFKSNLSAKNEDFSKSIKQYEVVFSDEENLLFLFNSLDMMYEIALDNKDVVKEKMNLFFESIFTTKEKEDYDDKITLFWNSPNELNLFENCINKGVNEENRNKILLYCIIHYLIKVKNEYSENGLKSYCRVLRNLMQAIRQRNNTEFNPNVRMPNFGNYWLLFSQLESEDVYATLQKSLDNKGGTQITDTSLENEAIKARLRMSDKVVNNAITSLEEFKYLGGLIQQLKPADNVSKLVNYSLAIKEIWSDEVSDTLKIQAMIACGFEGFHTKDCKMGGTYFFGKMDNWLTILTIDDEEISKNILHLMDTYLEEKSTSKSTQVILKEIVDKWLINNNKDRSWKYYFLKYDTFTSKLNYFAWPNDYQIRLLSSTSANPLVAYHINPYILTVCNLIADKTICDAGDCYHQYSGYSPLVLKNGITMDLQPNGWLIDYKDFTIPSLVHNKFNIIENDSQYILTETDKLDIIEVAVNFISELNKISKSIPQTLVESV